MSNTDLFSGILLEPVQKDLLKMLVEAYRNVPHDHRQMFYVSDLAGRYKSSVYHEGLPQEALAFKGDLEVLGRVGLLALTHKHSDELLVDINPLGFRYYEYLQQESDQPLEKIEKLILRYLSHGEFQREYSLAYAKWAEAEALLWSADSDKQLTTIGHLCREAMQEFATALIDKYQPTSFDSEKAHTESRKRSVLNMKTELLGDRVKTFLDTLASYWRTVAGLTQRQEHGAQKEGRPLVFEDGRRVVFQTAIVMYEVASALSLAR